MFRLDRVRDIGERFLSCGDCRLGVARIRCTTPALSRIGVGGGFHADGTFVSIPFSGDFAENLLAWRHSGFSVDNSVRAIDVQTQESFAQYISRPPVSLKKICYEPVKGRHQDPFPDCGLHQHNFTGTPAALISLTAVY